MSRNKKEEALSSASNADDLSALENRKSEIPVGGRAGYWIARAVFVCGVAALASAWQPFGLGRWIAAGAGLVAALLLALGEMRLRRAKVADLAGGAAGLVLGVFAALLICL